MIAGYNRYDQSKAVVEGREDKRFPEKREEKTVTHMAMTNDFHVSIY